jgi:CTP-dependent riboflavin kinase
VAERRRLNGVLFSDLGAAAGFMALDWVRQGFQRAVGFAPFPATLNARPKNSADAETWNTIKRDMKRIDLLPPGSGFCDAGILPVSVRSGDHSIDAAVILPEVADYPADKIEIVAPMRLKDYLGLEDGDALTLEFIL